jgi:hypothetical protein
LPCNAGRLRRRRIPEQFALRAMLGKHNLREVDVTLAESPFAPRQVKIPHGHETFAQSQLLLGCDILPEAFMPCGQRLRMVQSQAFDMSAGLVQRAIERDISKTEANSLPGKIYVWIQSVRRR